VPPDASPWTRGDVHKEIQLYQPLGAHGGLTTTTHTDFRQWPTQPRVEQRATPARPIVPFEGSTTTHDDYQEKELPRRAEPRPAEARPTLPFAGEFSGQTTQHHDFPVWEQPCAARPAGAYSAPSDGWTQLSGEFSGQTTQHHDFPVWEQPCAARPAGAYSAPSDGWTELSGEFSGQTINRQDYFWPQQPTRPQQAPPYVHYSVKFNGSTTTASDYAWSEHQAFAASASSWPAQQQQQQAGSAAGASSMVLEPRNRPAAPTAEQLITGQLPSGGLTFETGMSIAQQDYTDWNQAWQGAPAGARLGRSLCVGAGARPARAPARAPAPAPAPSAARPAPAPAPTPAAAAAPAPGALVRSTSVPGGGPPLLIGLQLRSHHAASFYCMLSPGVPRSSVLVTTVEDGQDEIDVRVVAAAATSATGNAGGAAASAPHQLLTATAGQPLAFLDAFTLSGLAAAPAGAAQIKVTFELVPAINGAPPASAQGGAGGATLLVTATDLARVGGVAGGGQQGAESQIAIRDKLASSSYQWAATSGQAWLGATASKPAGVASGLVGGSRNASGPIM